MTKYAPPGQPGSVVAYRSRYDHFIGGDDVPPSSGRYTEIVSPVTGEVFTEVAKGGPEDVERALDAAHGAARAWGRTSAAERANVLTEIADRVEENLTELAVAETWDNGKTIRETLTLDIPLVVEHFRHYAGAIRAQQSAFVPAGEDVVAYHFHEPIGVVRQRLPWNFPLLMAAWTLAPALAAGNTVVLEPAEETPASLHVLMGFIADLLPPGVVNVVTGSGEETLLAGKSPNIFFADVASQRDAFFDKALEGFAMFALNQGEVCTAPSRALIQTAMYEQFLHAATLRTRNIRQGDPLDTDTMIGAQVSRAQRDRVLRYVEVGKREGARLIAGGEAFEFSGGFYVTPTIFEGDNKMRIFQEDILGPVVAVTRFDDFDDAIKIANDTRRGLGAGVWCRDGNLAHRAGREIQADRVWVNNYHAYPADSAVLSDYQQTKHLLVSYSDQAQGFF
ncbi:aldehyde dehydrogenase family protein [Lentzea tibetensis]|uniref:Aldehyde dehydrogenase family protein n=1 Tax=Lentzea tibetensis TaxID=2591470 RepID=A0A563EY13_9PSEU|nr:aldehyde dehydrogenase family protein [Lentzea tibetensis]TWP52442.1 aldehyde dehydrogenase family protein [Lentzea tibetensis]